MKILFVVLLFFWIAPPLIAETQKPKVLSILPLSGEIAQIGNAVKNGMLLASEKQNVLKLYFEDDASIPKNTVSALRKHLSLEKPLVVICASSGTCKSIAPILEVEKIPLIAIATDEEISKGRRYAVNFWVTPDTEAELLIQEAQRRGYKKIAIFTTIHEGPLSIKRKFERANNNRLEVVYQEDFSPDMKDFRSVLAKYKSAARTMSVDAIFVNVFFGQIGIFAKQIRQSGVESDLFSIELFEDENEVKISQGALYNQWYVQAGAPEGQFLNEYQLRFPKESSFGAANGYDAVQVLVSGISDQRNKSEDINIYLHTIKNYQGACGTYSSTNDNRFTLPAMIKIVTKQGFKSAHEIESHPVN